MWHKWKQDETKYKTEYSLDMNIKVFLGFVCTECGFWYRMKYPIPEETLRFLEVPDCQTVLIQKVHDS